MGILDLKEEDSGEDLVMALMGIEICLVDNTVYIIVKIYILL
jgi:hypothetical protein